MILTCAFAIGLLWTFSSCEKSGLCKDDDLNFARRDYTGNQLRVDGYYFGDPSTDNNVNIYYFYRDGVFLDKGIEPLEDAETFNFTVDVSNEFGETIKGAWGVFQIDGSTIEIERWQSSSNGCETTLYELGEILNDSTFVITLREFRENGKVNRTEEANSEFYFRVLVQKPDSMNSFIQ